MGNVSLAWLAEFRSPAIAFSLSSHTVSRPIREGFSLFQNNQPANFSVRTKKKGVTDSHLPHPIWFLKKESVRSVHHKEVIVKRLIVTAPNGFFCFYCNKGCIITFL
jgi:hypothetical protein